MPCNAVSMRTATVAVDAILKTPVGVQQLIGLVESKLGLTVTNKSEADIARFVRIVKENGYAWLNTSGGGIQFWLDRDIIFPTQIEFADSIIEQFMAAYSSTAGLLQQAFIVRLLQDKLGATSFETAANGSIVLKGVIA